MPRAFAPTACRMARLLPLLCAASLPLAAEGGSTGMCCKTCKAPAVLYYSVDTVHGHCGECCMNPSEFKLFKIFEPNLTLAGNTTCPDLGWPRYSSTVTHGVWPVQMTLDLYDQTGPDGPRPAEGLGAFRTEAVTSSFDMAKADGIWYLIAFQDIAQAGASCQTIANSYDARTGELSQHFAVQYGPIPFALTFKYEPDASGQKGLYKKHLNGAKVLLDLPTVVVDAVEGPGGRYGLMTEFTRWDSLLTELRFLSRSPQVGGETLRKMKETAAAVGIEQSIIDGVRLVDHSGCPPPPAAESPVSAPAAAGGPVSAPPLLDDVMIVGPPGGKSGAPVAWIVLPGAQTDKDTYRPLAEAVQREAPVPVWVAVLGSLLTPTPVPPELGPRIDAALAEMGARGLDLGSARLFYGGHSLGSVFIQDHLSEFHGSKGPLNGSVEVLGQVLMGGFLQRKYQYPAWSYPVSTLTVGGELDGLARPTRLAEAFYHARGRPDFPVAIVPGLAHNQFASGPPPALVRLRDLQPEISYDEAHAAVAELVVSYFGQRAGLDGAGERLASRLRETAAFVDPIIEAYELEGARYFNAPGQIGGPGQGTCVKGGCSGMSSWAPRAQEIISAVDGWTLNVSNQYVDCQSTPLTGEEFHLPKITGDADTKTLSITTYSQGYWDDAQPSWFDWKEIFDSFDTGFVATSAEEIGTKLASRQCTLIEGLGAANTSFSADDPDYCRAANEQAYQWAKDHAGPKTAARFAEFGQKYTFGPDIVKSGGPLFLWSHLAFSEAAGPGGEEVVEVRSPMQKTEVDYWRRHFGPIPRPSSIPDPGCFHYCKLLSPARAVEWMYVDSLRLRRSLQSQGAVAAILV